MALTAIPAAGAKLRGSIYSANLTERTPLSGLKTSAQNVGPSNVTLQDVTEVSIAVVASAVYEFRLYFQYSSNATADIKVGWTLPVGGAGDFGVHYFDAADAVAAATTTMASAFSLSGARNYATLLGSITTGANAGTVQLQAAQNTSTAVTTNVEPGTLLIAHRIS